jgi:hypothetical protein
MKHTPGPWIASVYEGGWDCVKEGDHRGQEICRLVFNNQANAKLICKAPEMVELLSQIMNSLPLRHDWLDPDIEKQAKSLLTEIYNGSG